MEKYFSVAQSVAATDIKKIFFCLNYMIWLNLVNCQGTQKGVLGFGSLKEIAVEVKSNHFFIMQFITDTLIVLNRFYLDLHKWMDVNINTHYLFQPI